MANNKPSYIPNSLRNKSKEFPYIGGSIDIYDESLERDQQAINADLYEKMDSLSAQNFESYTASDGDTLADILPETGEADTIYRVGKWDADASDGEGGYDLTKYSEYAWNGTEYIPMDVRDMELGTAEDFESDDPEDLNKVPTVGAVLEFSQQFLKGEMEVISLTEDITLSATVEEGGQKDIIFTNDTEEVVTVTIPSPLYRTPDGETMTLEVDPGHYGEINLLNISGTTYIRAI